MSKISKKTKKLPVMSKNAFKVPIRRLQYNFDLIIKKYSKIKPSGLELDVDSGEIVQVDVPGRKRLTEKEADKLLRSELCAQTDSFGKTEISSPFVNDMNVSEKTKLRVLRHNKRFQRMLRDEDSCDYGSASSSTTNHHAAAFAKNK